MITDASLHFSTLMTQDSATEQAISNARHCIKHHYDTIWIEGEAGTGKSLLAHTICSKQIHQGHLKEVEICSISAPTRATLQTLLAPHHNQHIILHIAIQPNIRLAEMEQFQQQLVYHLNQNHVTVQVLCFMSYPISSYTPHVSKHLEMMQELFLEHKRSHIYLPALREKVNDIPLLAQHFLRQFSYHYATDIIQLSNDAQEALKKIEWKQNIKDLQQYCYNLALMDGVSTFYKHHITDTYNAMFQKGHIKPSEGTKQQYHMMVPLLDDEGNLRPFCDLEEDIFMLACKHRKGSKSSAARDLGIGRTTLYRKLKGK